MTKKIAQNKKRFVPVYLKTEGVPFFIECGRLNYDQVGEYITNITKSISELKKLNSDDFCSFDWDIDFQLYPNIKFSNCPIFSKIILSTEGRFNSVLCKARTCNGCFRKIKSGKCKDLFIRENIGKVFFVDKYKDDCQRG